MWVPAHAILTLTYKKHQKKTLLFLFKNIYIYIFKIEYKLVLDT